MENKRKFALFVTGLIVLVASAILWAVGYPHLRVDYKQSVSKVIPETGEKFYSLTAYHWYKMEIVRYIHVYDLTAEQVKNVKRGEDSVAKLLERNIDLNNKK